MICKQFFFPVANNTCLCSFFKAVILTYLYKKNVITCKRLDTHILIFTSYYMLCLSGYILSASSPKVISIIS